MTPDQMNACRVKQEGLKTEMGLLHAFLARKGSTTLNKAKTPAVHVFPVRQGGTMKIKAKPTASVHSATLVNIRMYPGQQRAKHVQRAPQAGTTGRPHPQRHLQIALPATWANTTP